MGIMDDTDDMKDKAKDRLESTNLDDKAETEFDKMRGHTESSSESSEQTDQQ